MNRSNEFIRELKEHGVEMFTGVPDSLLKGFISSLPKANSISHVIAANEGAAVGIAAGFHLSTGKIPLVYLQNSGLGNLVNPITSLADPEVYGIPLLLLIGWRGEPGHKDEPQHKKMGAVTTGILEALGIPFRIIGPGSDWKEDLKELLHLAGSNNQPVALLCRADFFEDNQSTEDNRYPMSSEEAIGLVYETLDVSDIVVCTTGKIGRLFYAINQQRKKISCYFLNVGAMGHTLSIGSALAKFTNRKVVVFDGDGSLLMHMGALAKPFELQSGRFQYFLLNNGSHQSVGAQPTLGFEVDFTQIAKGCGYKDPVCITQAEEMSTGSFAGHDFVEVRINNKTIDPLPRPSETPSQAKSAFMKMLGSID
jgi:phosphonopyruvate decarboxylase